MPRRRGRRARGRHGQALFVAAGRLGQNVTTSGIDLLGLPAGTLLCRGDEAPAEVIDPRNLCVRIDALQDGLLKQVVDREAAGNVVRKAGIMRAVRPGDGIGGELSAGPHRALERV